MSSEFNIDALVWIIDGGQHISFIDCGDPDKCDGLVSRLIEEVLTNKGIIDKAYIDLYYDIDRPLVKNTTDFAARIQGRGIYAEGPFSYIKGIGRLTDRVEIDQIQDEDIGYAVFVGGGQNEYINSWDTRKGYGIPQQEVRGKYICSINGGNEQ